MRVATTGSLTPANSPKSRNVIVIVPDWPGGTMGIKFGYVMCSALRCTPEDVRMIATEPEPTRIFGHQRLRRSSNFVTHS